MTGYDIFLSDGGLLTTINVKTIDNQSNSSLVLIGQGIPDYGTAIAQDFVWLTENFAKTTPPVHPLQGQQWYDKANKRMNFYDGVSWQYYASAQSSLYNLFDMLPAATNVDFTVMGTVPIFTGPDATKNYFPTRILMKPRGAFNALNQATIDLSVSTSGDVLSSISVAIVASSKFFQMNMNENPVFITGTGTLNLNITTAATGGALNYDVFIFGFVD